MDMNTENWVVPFPEKDMEQELKKIRRNLQRRNCRIILTCLFLVAALLIGTIRFVIPAAEQQFWNPDQKTFHSVYSDLAIALGVYAELFCPDQAVTNVTAQKNGFASYTLSVEMTDTMFYNDESYLIGHVNKGKMTLPDGIWDLPGRIFTNTDAEMPATPKEIVQKYNNYIYNVIDSFPDYLEVFAAVSFPKDLNMKEFVELEQTYQDTCRFGWIAIRIQNYEDKVLPLCGMKPSAPAIGNWETVNETYPYFQVNTARFDEEHPEIFYEEHFKTLLRFSLDQVNAGTGLTPRYWYDPGTYHPDGSYYSRALDYVEENGVYTYGGYVYASPDTLLEMMDKGIICDITYQDSWLDPYPILD